MDVLRSPEMTSFFEKLQCSQKRKDRESSVTNDVLSGILLYFFSFGHAHGNGQRKARWIFHTLLESPDYVHLKNQINTIRNVALMLTTS